VFLDGTAQYNSMRNVPAMDRGARVLVVKPGGAEVVRIPWNAPEEFQVGQDFRVSILPNGAAEFDGKARFTGDFSVWARQNFSVEGKRQIELSKILGASLGKHSIERAEFPDLKDLSSPEVEVGLKVRLDSYAQADGARMTVPVKFVQVFPVAMILSRLAALEKREHDMVLFNPISIQEKAVYAIPEGWRVAKLPDAKDVTTPFARFRVEVAEEGGAIRFEREFRFTSNRVPKDQYAAFRGLITRANSALTEKIVLEKAAAGDGAPAAPAPAGEGK
jgi:hypothetical protein